MEGVPESRQSPAVEGLAIEAVEWLPSGTDAGLVRVRGRWADPADRPAELPALCVRAGRRCGASARCPTSGSAAIRRCGAAATSCPRAGRPRP